MSLFLFMKRKRFNVPALQNSSKGHVTVLELLVGMFPNNIFAQEYSYYDILYKSYKRNRIDEDHRSMYLLKQGKRLHADIYDLTYDIIYEIQGKQHYEPVVWTKKMTEDQITKAYQNQIYRDKKKREIAKEADVKLIEIPYYDLKEIDDSYFWERIA